MIKCSDKIILAKEFEKYTKCKDVEIKPTRIKYNRCSSSYTSVRNDEEACYYIH